MQSEYLDEERRQRADRLEFDFGDRLDGRTVLVAGGTGGLGTAVAARLMHEGADVILGYRGDAERAEAVARGLAERYEGRTETVAGDLSTEEGLTTLVRAADREALYGAAICVGDPARVDPGSAGIDDLQASLAVNFTGPVLLARRCAELLEGRGASGAVVMLSSMQGVAAFPGSLAYSGPKSALVHGARILAQEFGPAVRVNVVAPGVNQAGMALSSIRRGKYDFYVENGTIPRFGYPEDVARAVGFLMAPDNYVTGQTLLVDGGLTLRRGMR